MPVTSGEGRRVWWYGLGEGLGWCQHRTGGPEMLGSCCFLISARDSRGSPGCTQHRVDSARPGRPAPQVPRGKPKHLQPHPRFLTSLLICTENPSETQGDDTQGGRPQLLIQRVDRKPRPGGSRAHQISPSLCAA